MSYSKIRHIQNTNMLLERRYLYENDPEPNTTDKSTIIDMWVKKLPEAQKWWKDWLGHETTKTKFIKLNNLDTKVADDYYKKYFNMLDNIKYIFYDVKNKLMYDSPNYTPTKIDPRNYIYVHMMDKPQSLAFVNRDYPLPAIHVNLNNPSVSIEKDIVGAIVHEIQHLLYNIFPLNPDQKVGEFASSGDGCFDKNYEKYNDTKIDAVDKFKMLAGENIKNIAIDLGVTEEDVVKFIKPFIFGAYSDKGYGRNYLFSKSEIDSFVIGTKESFGIKPSENLTKEQLKNYILNFNFNTSNYQVFYVLVHWAMKGFPPLEDFVNELNSFAKTDPTKQKPSPLDSPYQPKDYYS